MLRSTWSVAILAAGLVLVLGLSVCDASPRKGRKPPRAKPAPPPIEAVVDGNGRDAREASRNALVNAQERVTELLRDEAGDPNWNPPADLLDPEYLAEKGVIEPQGDPKKDADGNYEATYKIQLKDDYLRTVQKQTRQDRVMERNLHLLPRLLGGLLAVLLVTAGYLRLEEMTHGYATQLLRLAAFAALALAGLALWLTL